MNHHLRADLLRLVCSALPEAEAGFIRSLPADDFLAHAEAYCAVRRLGIDLPEDLRDLFVASLLSQLDDDTVGPRAIEPPGYEPVGR
jgi:hypothetical protein